jgi:hypothetical protein
MPATMSSVSLLPSISTSIEQVARQVVTRVGPVVLDLLD